MATRPKPPISLWIKAERKRLGWKVPELSRRLIEAGYSAEVGTIRVWEAGRSPKAETIAALERLFGSTAPRDQEAPSPDLAVALRELVEEVRLSRLAQERSAAVLVDLIGLVAQGRLPQSGSAVEGAALDRQGTRR